MAKSSSTSSFHDSLKTLNADIQYANTLAFDSPRENDGAHMQMRLTSSPAARFFLFLVQWNDYWFVDALGLLRILIYMTYADGRTTMNLCERKATIREFYAVILPSLTQVQRGITDLEDRKQRDACNRKYRRKTESQKDKLSEIDAEREQECGICMEMNSKVVLPNCAHSLCFKCYKDWCRRSKSCPFCRDNLKAVKSDDLWICTDTSEIVVLPFILKENCERLFMNHCYAEQIVKPKRKQLERGCDFCPWIDHGAAQSDY